MPHKSGTPTEVTSLTDYLEFLLKFKLTDFLARGESKEYKNPFLPSMWRDDHNFKDRTPLSGDTTFTQGELDSLNVCRDLFLSGKIEDKYFSKFMADPFGEINLTSPDLFQWAALAQHHNQGQIHPTRLVDVTTDPFVALYFAVNSNPNHSGFVYLFNGNLNDLRSGTSVKRGGTYLDVVEVDYQNGLVAKNADKYPVLDQTPYPNRRIEAQRGAFLWTREIAIDSFAKGLVIEIAPDHKKEILRGLDHLKYSRITLLPTDPKFGGATG